MISEVIQKNPFTHRILHQRISPSWFPRKQNIHGSDSCPFLPVSPLPTRYLVTMTSYFGQCPDLGAAPPPAPLQNEQEARLDPQAPSGACSSCFLQLRPFFEDLQVVGINVPLVSLTAGYLFQDAGVFKLGS